MPKISKLLFVHDHVFISKSASEIYSSGCFPADVWDRYLGVFDQVKVLARNKPGTEATQSLTPTMREHVSFTFAEDASNLRAVFGFNRPLNQLIQQQVDAADVIIARLSSELGLLAIAEAKRQRKPYAIELVDCPFDSYWNYGSLKARLYAPYMYYRVRSAVKNAPFVLYVTEHFLQRRYPNKLANTVACSNVSIPTPPPEVLNARIAKIRIKDARKPIKLGQIASLTGTFKGIHTAIEALALANKQGGNFEYHVLGAGDATAHIDVAKRFGVADKVHFDGVLASGDEVYQWLDELDVYIHPSMKEGLPRAVIEAMSRGCPVIASSVAGTPELLPQEWLIAPGDAQSLAAKLHGVVKNHAQMMDTAQANFAVAKRYARDELNRRRSKFWQQFKLYAESSSEKSGK